MDLAYFSEVNRSRCEAVDGFNPSLDGWNLSEWMTATVGELGEAANVIKKLNRVRDGIPGNKETAEELRIMLGKEIADTFCYLDLMATAAGFSLEKIAIEKFNEVSARLGSEIRI